MRWKSHTVTASGMRLAVRDSGGVGRPVVLIHGLGFGQRAWDRVAPRLGTRLRVVTYDQRGHGASATAADYSPAAFNADLTAVIAALRLEEVVLVGHSLGATIAIEHAAARVGCAGIVGVDGGVPVVLPRVDWERLAVEARTPRARLATWVMQATRLGAKLSLADLKRVVATYETRVAALGEAYARIACPLLVVVGSRADPVPHGAAIQEAMRQGVRELEAAQPQVRVAWLPCGHHIPLERPAALADLILEFVAAVP